jgi:hypothetical protein
MLAVASKLEIVESCAYERATLIQLLWEILREPSTIHLFLPGGVIFLLGRSHPSIPTLVLRVDRVSSFFLAVDGISPATAVDGCDVYENRRCYQENR